MHTNTHLRRRRLTALAALLASASVFALTGPSVGSASSSVSSAYGWPIKPFFRQHPVRGFFGDPRIAGSWRHETHSFHFGVDVSAPDGTPVYATLAGDVLIDPANKQVAWIRGDDGTIFAYWHVNLTVRNGQRAIAYRTMLGRIARGWGHVHFAELRAGRYVNPLRPGAMGPYADRTRPSVHAFSFERDGAAVDRRKLHGPVDIVVEAFDETPLAVSAPWDGKPVTPALVRWRLVRVGTSPGAWSTAADFRRTIPENSLFGSVYARWTRQNHARSRARYRFVLARKLDTGRLGAGGYRVDVLVSDTRGNASRSSARFTIA